MNFSENLRNGLTNVAAGLTNLGHSLENIHKQHHDWNEESRAEGLISDEDKLRMLKRDLYYEVRLNSPNQQKILNITSAIQTLEEIKHAQESREFETRKLNLTLPAQINLTLNSALMFVLLVVIGSYTATWTCGNSHSMFCGYARSVVQPINDFFREPRVNF